MKNPAFEGQLQAKHVRKLELLEWIAARCKSAHRVATLYAIEAELGMPWKLALAVAIRLEARGWIDGCTCGCGGNFTVTLEGYEALARSRRAAG
jgi:hypothetical protein